MGNLCVTEAAQGWCSQVDASWIPSCCAINEEKGERGRLLAVSAASGEGSRSTHRGLARASLRRGHGLTSAARQSHEGVSRICAQHK